MAWGMPTLKIAGMLVEKAGVSADPLEVASHKEKTFVASLVTPGIIQPIAPVVEIARAHRAEGPLAIASGGQRHLVERTLGIIGIADWFSVVLSSEDTMRHKPEPDVFLEAARRLGVEPADCTVYEDTDIGLEAARRANMRGVDVRPFTSASASHALPRAVLQRDCARAAHGGVELVRLEADQDLALDVDDRDRAAVHAGARELGSHLGFGRGILLDVLFDRPALCGSSNRPRPGGRLRTTLRRRR